MTAPFPSGPRHRLAVRADLPQLVAIYNSTVPSRRVTADTEPVSVADREGWFAAHRDPSRPLWVCEDAAGITAWLSFSSFYGRPAYRRTVELAVYVHPERLRQGLGRYLLASAIDHAPELGIDTLLGFIFGHNEPSIALFERFGFAGWGTLPRVALLDGVERDLLIFGRRC
jgi:phosphinothricin acetyltransferase